MRSRANTISVNDHMAAYQPAETTVWLSLTKTKSFEKPKFAAILLFYNTVMIYLAWNSEFSTYLAADKSCKKRKMAKNDERTTSEWVMTERENGDRFGENNFRNIFWKSNTNHHKQWWYTLLGK